MCEAHGLALFAGSTAILFLIASLNGLRSTSHCIASERRQGTLVLLFLAGLKLNTILTSKLVTNSMRNAWAFLGTLPILGVCLLLGGVSGLVFVQGVLAVLAAAWLSLMVGLDQSCLNQGEHEAFSKGLRELFKLNLIPFLSPASLVLSAFLSGGFFGKAYFLATLGATVSAGFYHWSQAKSALARNWQEPPPEEAPLDSSLCKTVESAVVGHLRKPPRLCGDTPPAYWLFARYGDARQVAPLPIGVAFVLISGFVAVVCDADIVKPAYLLMMGAGRFVQMLAMAKIAPQSFADIARPGALEILQTTPITLRQIVRAAYQFLFVQFRRGVLPMLALDALVLPIVALKTNSEDSAWGFAGGLLAQNSLLLSGLCAMGVTGIWLGLKQRNLSPGFLERVLLLPGIASNALCSEANERGTNHRRVSDRLLCHCRPDASQTRSPRSGRRQRATAVGPVGVVENGLNLSREEFNRERRETFESEKLRFFTAEYAEYTETDFLQEQTEETEFEPRAMVLHCGLKSKARPHPSWRGQLESLSGFGIGGYYMGEWDYGPIRNS